MGPTIRVAGAPLDELHDQVIRPDIVHGADLRMAQGCERARFPLEAIRESVVQELQGDSTTQAGIATTETAPISPVLMGERMSWGPSFVAGIAQPSAHPAVYGLEESGCVRIVAMQWWDPRSSNG